MGVAGTMWSSGPGRWGVIWLGIMLGARVSGDGRDPEPGVGVRDSERRRRRSTVLLA
jgi:hypothetical protein